MFSTRAGCLCRQVFVWMLIVSDVRKETRMSEEIRNLRQLSCFLQGLFLSGLILDTAHFNKIPFNYNFSYNDQRTQWGLKPTKVWEVYKC